MSFARSRPVFATGALASLLLLLLTSTATPDEPKKKPTVRLAVLVVFDQLRGDYPQRWEEHFGRGGFRRLTTEGVWFQNCHYPYAATLTGPGHASLASGTAPDRHGIIGNEWYERKEGGQVYCAGNVRYQRVPPLPPKDVKDQESAEKKEAEKEAEIEKLLGQGTPDRLLAPTLSDALKEATGGRGRVVALSLKDRSSVLPGGHKPDACYWFDTTTGTFVTSTYYRETLHPWIRDFNATKPADASFGKPWTHFRSDLDYVKYSGPDDAPGAGIGSKQGKTFPHAMDGGLKKPGKAYYEALYTSPFGNEMLLDLVKTTLDAEKLGKNDVPDLLCISFSCNDPIGHVWGPDSQEVLDVTLDPDVLLKNLLDTLDAKVGKGQYILALSADHGICPLPEAAAKQGHDAKRILPADLRKDIDAFLEKTFAQKATGKPVKVLLNDSIYLNLDWVKAQGVRQSAIEQALAEWLPTHPGIQTAYTRTQLVKGVPENDALGRMVARSFQPERSGDVMFVVKPYHFVSSRLTGTTHGSPHSYDTHVPLMVFGPGLVPGVRQNRVTPQANVPILARALGIEPPAKCDFPLPEKVFK